MIRSLFASAAVVSLAFASVACSGAPGDSATAGSAAVTESTGTTAAHVYRATDANNVAVVNEESTACADGKREDSCAVDAFDFSALGLSSDDAATLESEVRAGTAIVQGTLGQVEKPVGGGSQAIELLSTLQVTAAWAGPSTTVIAGSGTFQNLQKNAATCGAINASSGAVCETYALTTLNKGDVGGTNTVDFTASAASSDAINAAQSALDSTGLVTFGYFEGVARGPMTFEVTAFFLPVTASN